MPVALTTARKKPAKTPVSLLQRQSCPNLAPMSRRAFAESTTANPCVAFEPRIAPFGCVAGARWTTEFATLVAPHIARMKRLARRILRSDDLADDAVQETLLSLWKEPAVPHNLAGWLSRAVVHRSLHLHRCQRRRRVHEELACLGRTEFDQRQDASRRLEAIEVRAAIDAAVAQLPERLREVFILRAIDEMDYEAIASELGVPLGTVRSRLSRSREALQAALRGDWFANGASPPAVTRAQPLGLG